MVSRPEKKYLAEKINNLVENLKNLGENLL